MVGVRRTGAHDVALDGPGPGGTAAGRVADLLVSAGGGVDHVIERSALVEPGPLGEAVQRYVVDASRGADHVRVQLHVPEGAVPPVHVRLAVVVDEHRGID